MPAMANQDHDVQALYTELRRRLVETGEWDHMRTVLQARLGEHGWLDSTANTCKEQAKAMETPSVKALYDEARPNAKNEAARQSRAGTLRLKRQFAMQGPPKRKRAGSQPLNVSTKRTRWENDLSPPHSESSPTASGSAWISGVRTVRIHDGAHTMVGRDIRTTVHNHNYGPQIISVDVLEILNSLSLPNSRDIQLDTLSKATKGTCVWFTTGKMFLLWIAEGKILWGIGIPGAGKTVLASIVIHDLGRLERASGGTICVAYVYLRYSQPLTVRDVLESFVKQIVERHADLGPLVENLYLLHKRERTKPSQEELQDLLHTFIECGKTIFFVLDALDELRAEHRPVLLGILATLDAKLFITSRRSSLETLQQQLYQAEVFEIAATPSDLDLYIKDFFRHSPDVMTLLEGTDYEERIVEAVHRKSGGMFLHAKLQLEALHHCISALDVEETLEGFPTNIEAIYAKTWERILDQGHKRSNLAKLVLLWITHARGEMTIDTLRHAVATCPETHVFEHKRMVPETLLLSACCGLVSVDEKTRLVRLMHYTAQDAILPRILEFFPVPHAILALVCVAHLTSCGLQNYRPDAGAGDEEHRDFMVRLSNDPFLAYTHRSWVHHTRQCHNYAPVTAAASELLLNCTQYPLADQSPIDFGGPLHVAAFYGLEDFIPPAALRQSPNAQTSIYKAIAVDAGSPAWPPCFRQCPSITAQHRPLVEAPGIDINAVDEDGMTALIHAVQMGQTEAAKILLGLPGIDVNAADREFKGWTALIHAAWEGQTEVVKLLLGVPGICINAVDEAGCSALIHAVREGSTEVVKLLLKAPGIDVNAASNLDGHTALSLAMRRGHREIVDLLLAFPGTIIPLTRDVL
ncbi:hypothetical protein BKA70DRAFT_1403752 [Coprinopsis sp. MPI-PUGE-AT-0042]|nr:hypothetical protein BKA70DRAFT_1403752 [Coprinopsis sp. MPI-PUGE-AT-0042]